jgi:hypothetical protein
MGALQLLHLGPTHAKRLPIHFARSGSLMLLGQHFYSRGLVLLPVISHCLLPQIVMRFVTYRLSTNLLCM